MVETNHLQSQEVQHGVEFHLCKTLLYGGKEGSMLNERYRVQYGQNLTIDLKPFSLESEACSKFLHIALKDQACEKVHPSLAIKDGKVELLAGNA